MHILGNESSKERFEFGIIPSAALRDNGLAMVNHRRVRVELLHLLLECFTVDLLLLVIVEMKILEGAGLTRHTSIENLVHLRSWVNNGHGD